MGTCGQVERHARKWWVERQRWKEQKSGGMVAGSRRQMATGEKIPESLSQE